MPDLDYQEIIEFWFGLDPKQWWSMDLDLDALIQTRFAATHSAAHAGECHVWRERPRGRLAEIIVLDQFSRNLFREKAEAFACDGMALVLAQEAIAAGADRELTPEERVFLYIPYMHSESVSIHRQAERLFYELGLEENYEFELKHKAIIERFGRYPHRNQVLNRESTPEERQFLTQPGSSF